MYGKGIDWAGRVIEAISGCSLEEYMKRNIFEPLGMDSTTFFVKTRPDLEARKAEVSITEGPNNPLAAMTPPGFGPAEIAVGGSGLFSTAGDYGKLLGALVSEDPRILSPEALRTMYSPQLDNPAPFQAFAELPVLSPIPDAVGADYPRPIQTNHALCGGLNMEDIPKRRKKGSVTWRGMTNGYWWIDPESGIAATMYLQVLPFGIKEVTDLSGELEEETYRLWGGK
jgi:CubicO group peptidase (beta-lactamase class C family)